MTILFMDDWNKYPNAILDVNTKNESFLKLSAVYREMGVNNHGFILSLLQPELSGIDPHEVDPNDLETMSKIVYECKYNFWYFIREVVRVPSVAGVKTKMFIANRANIALYWFFLNHIITILIQPRQTGKSFSTDTLMIYLLNYGLVNSLINLLTRSDGLRSINLIRLKKIQDELPFFLDFRSKGDIFNTEEIKLNSLNNMYRGNLSNLSPKLANNVGRGFTSPILHVDEACFVPNIRIALTAALMAGNAAREDAKLNNMPYGTILTTTTGKLDDEDADYIFSLIQSATVVDEAFYDSKNEEQLKELIYKNSRALDGQTKRAMVNITMSYRQLGYDDNWMRQKLEETIAEGEDADRDLFNRWTSGSRKSPIPSEYSDDIRKNVKENYRTEIYAPYNYVLRWYKTKEEIEYLCNTNCSFIIGIDTSDAVGRDDITLNIRNHKNGEVLCVGTFNEINLITIADFFSDLLLKYLNSVMIIERRSSAPAIIDYIMQKLLSLGINPFKRLYNTIVQNADENKKLYEQLLMVKPYNADFFIQNKKHIGFTTSGSGITSRSELYSTTLISMCKYTGTYLNDKELVDQLLALVIRNNRVDHPEGGHDDAVIASLLNYFLLINGKNLEYYGIDKSTLFSTNNNYLNEKYSNVNLEQEEILAIENEISYLLDQYQNEKNEYILRQITNRLKFISEELNSSYNKAISVEQLLDQLKTNKKLRK